MNKIIDILLSIFGVLKSIYRAGNSLMDKLPFLRGDVTKNVVWICILGICYHFIFVESNSPDSPVRRYCEALAAGDYEKAVDQQIYGDDTSGDDEGVCMTRSELKEDRRIRALMLSRVYDKKICKAFGSYRILGVDPETEAGVVLPRCKAVRVELSDGDERLTLTAHVFKCDNRKWKIMDIGDPVLSRVADPVLKAPEVKRTDVERQDGGSKPERKPDEPFVLKILHWFMDVVKLIFVLGLVAGGLANLYEWLRGRS